MVMKAPTKERSRGLWWKIIAGGLLLLLIAVSVIILKVDAIALSLVNRALEASLVKGGQLESIHFELLSGRCELDNLSIDQPRGFTEPALLSLGKLTVQVDPATLLCDEIVVDKVAIENVAVRLIRDKQGQLNIENLLVQSDQPPSSPTTDNNDFKLPAVWVKSIGVGNLAVHVVDHLTKKQWTANLRIDLTVDDLQLRDIFHGDVLIGKVMLALSNLHIDQPAGFGSDKLLTLDKLAVKTTQFDFSSAEYLLDDISLQGFTTSIIIHKDGASNIQQLFASLLGLSDGEFSEVGTDVSSESSFSPIIRIGQVDINGGTLTLHDEALMEQSLNIFLEKISIQVEKLSLFDPASDADPASIKATFELLQPEGLPTAYFCGFATLGPVGNEIPNLNSQTRLVGLKLDTLGSLIPTAERKALGASGLDAGTSLSLNSDSIKLHGRALTDRYIIYDTINIQGPLSAPKVKIGALLAGFNRIKGGLVNLGKDSLFASFDIGKAGVNVTKGVGVGAYRLGKHLGGHLFNVGAGLLTLDAAKVGAGVIGTTSGTVGLTSDMIKETSTTTAAGLKNSASSLQGSSSITIWEEEIPERYRMTMIQAQAALAEMPYPPVTE